MSGIRRHYTGALVHAGVVPNNDRPARECTRRGGPIRSIASRPERSTIDASGRNACRAGQQKEVAMMRLTIVKLFVTDQEEARRFYVDQLGFVVAEDNRLGDYRWLLVRAPDTHEVAINLELAQTEQQRKLVGQ